MDQEPILAFKSNANMRLSEVTIWPDRIEFRTPSIWGKRAAAEAAETIPVKSISSVTSKKDGLAYTKVSVIVSGNTIDFRVPHKEAAAVKDVLTQLLLGSHPSQEAAAPPPGSSPAPPPVSVATELKNLAELRDAGVLTDAEFEAQKARLLA